MGEFERLAQEIMAYMKHNHHPHCTLIATSNNVELVEGLKATTYDESYHAYRNANYAVCHECDGQGVVHR